MKLLYNASGKVKLCKTSLHALAQILGYIDTRQIIKQIEKLKELEWIRYNSETKYYLIYSYDKIRAKYKWKSRYAIVCNIEDISNIYALIGAALYTYLHKVFWNKVTRERVVRYKGGTYHTLSRALFPSYNRSAPIATTGISKLYNISISKASRLKLAAKEAGFIEVTKSFIELQFNAELLDLAKVYIKGYVFRKKGKIYLQSIDLILPRRVLKKRQKLKT